MKIAHNIWASVLSGLAILCLALALVSPAIFPLPLPAVDRPATVADAQAVEQDRRITVLEAVGSEHRLTVIETNVDEIRWELRAMLGGLGGLLIEAVMRFSKRREA